MTNPIATILANNTKLLRGEGLSYLGLFGSHSRNDAHSSSDVDLLVEFHEPKSFFELANIKMSLEKILGKSVDLVLRKALKKNVQKYVDKDLITIYEER